MMKGAQKQLIVLRTGGSRYFDEAYFVLKPPAAGERRESRDMVFEANRILREHLADAEERGGDRRCGRRWFAAGLFVGVAVGALALLAILWIF